jgi:hypothetical protein
VCRRSPVSDAKSDKSCLPARVMVLELSKLSRAIQGELKPVKKPQKERERYTKGMNLTVQRTTEIRKK